MDDAGLGDSQTKPRTSDAHLYRACAFHCSRLQHELREFQDVFHRRPTAQALFHSQNGEELRGTATRRGTTSCLGQELKERDGSLSQTLEELLDTLRDTEIQLHQLETNFLHRVAVGSLSDGDTLPLPEADSKRQHLTSLHLMKELGYTGLSQTDRVAFGLERDGTQGLKLCQADCVALTLSRGSPITEMELRGCCIGNEGLEVMSGLLLQCSILRLDQNHIRDLGMTTLADSLRDSKCRIQELSLDNNDVSAVGFREFARGLCKNRSLRRLSLSNNPLGGDGLVSLCKGLTSRGTCLEDLRLAGCSLRGNQCDLLAQTLRESPSVRSLDLDNNNLGDSGVRRLLPALRRPDCRIRTLRLCTVGLTASGMESLGRALGQNHSLRDLALSYNSLGSLGAKRLCASLGGNGSRLQRLDLASKPFENSESPLTACSLSCLFREGSATNCSSFLRQWLEFLQEIRKVQDRYIPKKKKYFNAIYQKCG
ncbi:NACHT, LRR and PYD domains-containing protein 12-like isoform X2 [Narcine bancroftii]|uniref:NACHT, LRR and PYD domains-containing protein 12-like isoform X2 n=1 Tax=Narcine bancroftii TaxID=1343680 RepID=UPI003831AC09